MKRNLILFIIFYLSGLTSFVYANDSTDSIRYFKNKIISEQDSTILGEHYFELARQFQNIFEHDSAEYYGLVAINLLIRESNSWLTGKAYYNLGAVYSKTERMPEALDAHFKALNHFEKINDTEWEANALNVIGNTFYYIEEFNKALGFYNRALELFESIEDHIGVGSIYHNIGIIYGERNDLEKELEYYQKTVALYKAESSEIDLIMPYTNMGLNYENSHQLKKALEYHRMALEIAELHNQQDYIPYIIQNIGSSYYKLEQYETAIGYHETALELAEKQEDELVKSMALWHLAMSHKSLKNYEKAFEYLFAEGIADSLLYSEKNARIIHDMEAKYHVGEIDHENQLLRKQDEIQSAELRQQQLIIWFVGGGLALFLVFSGVLLVGNKKIHRQKKQIEGQTQKLRDMDEYKSRFFANISHDIRTPLTLISGYTHQIKSDISSVLSPKVTTNLSRIESNIESLRQMSDEIRDLILLEEGNIQLKYEEVDINSYLRELVYMFGSTAEIKSTELIYTSEVETLNVNLDKTKFEQIMYNLLSNAFKYSPSGGKVCVHLEESDGQVKVLVEDTGKGIHQDHIESIFDRYYQAPDNDYKTKEGFGIGLALVKELIQLHNGSITVDSKLGFGTQFTILLPLNLDKLITKEVMFPSSFDFDFDNDNQEALEPNMVPINDDGRAIVMVVDDHPEVREYICSIVEPSYSIIRASNGQDALKKLNKSKVDLIITDLMMPWLDGFGLIEKLGQDESLKDIPIMVVSARTTEEDKIKVLDKGVNEFICKPFDPDELAKRVDNIISKKSYSSNDLWQTILSKKEMVGDVRSSIIKKINNLIIEKIDDPALSVNDLAEEICASERKTYRLIKELTSLTPLEYIKSIRFQYAKGLIDSNKVRSVSEAARAIGMRNTTLFSRQYEKKFGRKPVKTD